MYVGPKGTKKYKIYKKKIFNPIPNITTTLLKDIVHLSY